MSTPKDPLNLWIPALKTRPGIKAENPKAGPDTASRYLMLNAVFLIFLPPLYLGFLWNAKWVAQTANRALEQTQLDAVSLSICYQNQEFLTDLVRKPNQQIVVTQTSLNIAGASCLAEFIALSATLTPALAAPNLAICVSSRMRAFEAKGHSLEKLQALAASEYQIHREKERAILLKENHLHKKFISYSGFSAIRVGFTRAPLNSESIAIQSQLAVLGHSLHWPKMWISNPPHFDQAFSPRFIYQPNHARGLRKTSSFCQLIAQDPLGKDQLRWRATSR